MADCSQTLDLIAPHFSGSASKAGFIALAEQQTSQSAFGDNYCLAVAYRAAHMMTLANRGASGTAGNAQSKNEGGMSLSYGTVNGVMGDLSQTHYGIQLQQLIMSNIPGASVTGGASF